MDFFIVKIDGSFTEWVVYLIWCNNLILNLGCLSAVEFLFYIGKIGFSSSSAACSHLRN